MYRLIIAVTLAACAIQVRAALQIDTGPASDVVSTQAMLCATLVSTNGTNPICTVYYGLGNGGSTASSWSYTNQAGTFSTGAVSVVVSNLTPATWYYFRWYAAETTDTYAWAAAYSNFQTTARAPTNWPTLTNGGSVMARTNGALLSPLGFFSANDVPTNAAELAAATNAHEIRIAAVELTTNASSSIIKCGDTTTITGRVYQLEAANTWSLAANTNEANCSRVLGLAVGTNSSSQGIRVFGEQTVTNNDLTVGAAVYVHDLGEFTQTVPTTDGSIIRAIGHASATNKIFISPDISWITVGYDLAAADAALSNSVNNLIASDAALSNTAAGFIAADAALSNSVASSIAADAALSNTAAGFIAADAALSNSAAELGQVDTNFNATIAELGQADTNAATRIAELGQVDTNFNTTIAELGQADTNAATRIAELGQVDTNFNFTIAELGQVDTNLTTSIAELGQSMTNLYGAIVWTNGVLDGTNGIYFKSPFNGSNYWILVP